MPYQTPKKQISIIISFSIAVGLLWLLQSILVKPPKVVLAQGSNLIQNGDFDDGFLYWAANGDTELVDQSGNYVIRIGNNGNINQISISPSQTGVYRLAFDCLGTDSNSPVGFDITHPDPLIFAVTSTGQCDDSGSKTISGTYTLEASRSYTVTIGRCCTYLDDVFIDNVSLAIQHTLNDIDLDTGLIENGEFIGPDTTAWTYKAYSGDGYHRLNLGEVITTVGSTWMKPDTRIDQIITPPATAVYLFALDCRGYVSGSNTTSLKYVITHPDPTIQSIEQAASCPNEVNSVGEAWGTFTDTYVLEAGEFYTVTIHREHTAAFGNVAVDNVKLTLLHPESDIDVETGLIANGEFIGKGSQWVYDSNTFHYMNVGERTKTVGSALLEQLDQIVTPTEAGAYMFALDCRGDVSNTSASTTSLKYQITPIDATEKTVSCPNQDNSTDNAWGTFTNVYILEASKPYTVTLHRQYAGAFGKVYVDNIKLTGPILLDGKTLAGTPQCPLCTTSAQAYEGGINTLSGNATIQETLLNIPIVGNALQFVTNFASHRVGRYGSEAAPFSGGVSNALSEGWVHNYEMRLRFDNTQLTKTIELQSPGGSLLPFFIDDSGPVDKYIPYPGVTAQLTYTVATNEYLVTAFNQNEYRFNSNGQLLEQKDAFGNAVTFTYQNNQLRTAAQGSRSLTYTYDPVSGFLTTVTDNIGREVHFGYNNNDDVIAITNTLGVVTRYAYSGTTHLLTTVTDPSGRIDHQYLMCNY